MRKLHEAGGRGARFHSQSNHVSSNTTISNNALATTTTAAWQTAASVSSLHQSTLNTLRSEYASPFLLSTAGQRMDGAPFIAKVF